MSLRCYSFLASWSETLVNWSRHITEVFLSLMHCLQCNLTDSEVSCIGAQMPLKFSVFQSEVISGACCVNIHVKCSVVLKGMWRSVLWNYCFYRFDASLCDWKWSYLFLKATKPSHTKIHLNEIHLNCLPKHFLWDIISARYNLNNLQLGKQNSQRNKSGQNGKQDVLLIGAAI